MTSEDSKPGGTRVSVAGVDFSGAKEGSGTKGTSDSSNKALNNTFIARGELGTMGLEITEIKQVGSHALGQQLSTGTPLKAVGIDVPFSLPKMFLDFLADKAGKKPFQNWQDVAEMMAFMSFEDFSASVNEFTLEPKRLTDNSTSRKAQSPLHKVNPSMVQMTYHGIRLLAMLDPKKFYVDPFQDKLPSGCAVMEVYPRATLFSLGLPDTGYKGKDKAEARTAILAQLTTLRDKKGETYRMCPRLVMGKNITRAAEESDHALDALIACYCVAMRLTCPEVFKDPFDADDLDVLLEGWIYAPEPLAKA